MNENQLTIGSICAGIGGFDLAFERQGFVTKWYCELDAKCQAVLAAKFPAAEAKGDLCKFKPDPSRDRVDVICGGTPCQDLSVAGQRKGLDGSRSGLFYQMVRVCKRLRPRVIVWENVPGAFSSNYGRDFAAVIRAFTGLQVKVPSDGWGNAGFVRTPFPLCRWNVAWRVLDAQYFGLAQRRERVFLVGSLGDASCVQILFEPESVCGNPPPSRETRQRITGTLSARSAAGGGLGSDFEIGGGLVEMSKGARKPEAQTGQRDVYHREISHCLNGGGMTAEGHDASEDGSGRGTPIIPILEVSKGTTSRGQGPNGCGIGQEGDPMFTLQAGAQHAVAFSQNQREELRQLDVAGSQSSIRRGDAKNETLIAFPQNLSSTQCASTEDKSPSLQAENPTAVAFTERTRADGRAFECQEEVAYALTRTHSRQIATQSTVRRLTPRECERLQGFPDDYTAGQADSPRCRQLGNAVAVPVVEWIAKRISAHL